MDGTLLFIPVTGVFKTDVQIDSQQSAKVYVSNLAKQHFKLRACFLNAS